MNQIDILRHAKGYLEQLGRRVDPISGIRLPAGSAAWEEALAKLFYFSARSLEYIIAYDSEAVRPSFSITPAQRKGLTPADGPVGLTELTAMINRRVDLSECRGLGSTILRRWLAEQGYLQKTERNSFRPTPRGEALGIRTVQGRLYLKVCCDRTAQEFVFSHLEEISRYDSGSPAKASCTYLKRPENLRSNLQGLQLLARGLHPTTRMPLDPRDPLGQERLRKCFDYVAGAFSVALEAGFFTARRPFFLPRERWEEIPITREPVGLLAFTAGVNTLIDPTVMLPLRVSRVRRYLEFRNVLQKTSGGDGAKKRITAEGAALGVTEEERIDQAGKPYTAVLFGPDAQRYLVEHLEEIAALAKA